MRTTINIKPMGYVRRTRADAWKGRPIVARYNEYKDAIRAATEGIHDGTAYRLTFYTAMPKSWSKKKQATKLFQWHDQKPDLDNMVKAVFDATQADDSKIHYIEAYKFWGNDNIIIVEKLHENYVLERFESCYSVGISN